MLLLPTALVEAGRALSRGEPLRALGLVGRSEDALGLTLRGIAYAQLGDLELARRSLERALALTGEPLLRARARAARVEVALGEGDAATAAREARASADALAALGDARNAAMQRLVLARAEVLLGRLDEARRTVQEVLEAAPTADLQAVALLARAELALRAIAPSEARDALLSARRRLQEAPNPLLERELAALQQELSRPVARLLRAGALREVDLFAVEAAAGGDLVLVDACRRLVVAGPASCSLARRPILFSLLGLLARAWPAPVARDLLAAQAFDTRLVNDSYRARLRVEVGRLRKALASLGVEPVATREGYALTAAREVALLLPLSDGEAARLSLLLANGAAWSARGLAEHAGVSPRTAQRALAALVSSGAALRTGSGKQVRYARPGLPLASRLLLLGLVPQR
ncbi:helix-turn-helix domain-containing protein [Aggregicoccus sp. 17bor-14]|uniref:helix-turn-helix domain-containing protein n=1 Tax=Myxococcaceae TaxID=31 RepID=UPI00129CDBD7|nr:MULTISPECIES: helix-turn-helix domain-containing protein [Myxococcaceae]MBF5043797.1 helix-turn-helix domain-containing protein [Simulacricoccus sp. 17bor-14]MRI89550.1 helix-turn-helix domain-containing protein [Aggregicoccus sp. 17bor-14]